MDQNGLKWALFISELQGKRGAHMFRTVTRSAANTTQLKTMILINSQSQ